MSVPSRNGLGGSGDRSSTPEAPVPAGLMGGGHNLDCAIMPASVFPIKRGDGGGGGGGFNEGGNGGDGLNGENEEGHGNGVNGGKNDCGMEDSGSSEDRHERESSASTDDLLIQLPEYNWAGFMARFEEILKEIGAEKEWLSKEYDMWNWVRFLPKKGDNTKLMLGLQMYEIWSSSRDHNDTHRLSREMATIIQWTRLKEADLERAREAHTQSMLAISSVLGIIPKNATPPLLGGKGKKH